MLIITDALSLPYKPLPEPPLHLGSTLGLEWHSVKSEHWNELCSASLLEMGALKA